MASLWWDQQKKYQAIGFYKEFLDYFRYNDTITDFTHFVKFPDAYIRKWTLLRNFMMDTTFTTFYWINSICFIWWKSKFFLCPVDSPFSVKIILSLTKKKYFLLHFRRRPGFFLVTWSVSMDTQFNFPIHCTFCELGTRQAPAAKWQLKILSKEANLKAKLTILKLSISSNN